jgi:transposase
MSITKIIAKLLRLETLLRVVDFEFKMRRRELHLAVKPYKNGRRCPTCKRRGGILRRMPEERIWRDVKVCGFTVFLTYSPREIICRCHGRIQEDIPWAAPMARITRRLEYLILTYSQIMTQKAAAEILEIAPSTFSDLLHRSVERARDGHRIRGLRAIGIDEVSYQKGHKYVTVVYDLDRSCVLWVGQGKERATIDRFFETELSDYQKAKIEWACCDMCETYIGAIKAHCPKARLVLDRFHIVKSLNNAVDEVRKEEWRKLKGDKSKAKLVKGLRWILYRHPSRRSKREKAILAKLSKGNRRIYRACILKDEFDHFWTYKAEWAARRFLNSWGATVMKSCLPPLKKFVTTLRAQTENIVGFASCRLTNAVAEGLNRIIRIVKNRASGFRSVQAFTDLIMLTVGDVDIPGQIPARYRTV